MPKIIIYTLIKADKKIVFDLSRSIDLHKISTQHTNEKAIAGVVTGLIGLHEQVTWEAKHFGITQQLTSKITTFKQSEYFTDDMVEGAFKKFTHQHLFSTESSNTKMTDIFDYESPFGVLGRFADFLFLKKYMTKLLTKRNAVVKEFAESEKWKEILQKQ